MLLKLSALPSTNSTVAPSWIWNNMFLCILVLICRGFMATEYAAVMHELQVIITQTEQRSWNICTKVAAAFRTALYEGSHIWYMQADIKSGQADLCQACRQSLAHGVLLALRYLAPLLPWQGPGVDQGQDAALRPWLQGLLQLLEEATDLVLQPLSKPQDSNIGAWQCGSWIACCLAVLVTVVSLYYAVTLHYILLCHVMSC